MKVGDVWTNEFTLESQRLMVDFKGTFELKELTSDYAIIHVNTISDKSKSTVEAEINGDVKIDLKTGWVLTANGNNMLKGKTTVDNPMDPNGDKMEVSLDVSSVITDIGAIN